jgi:CBS domain-containing protein
MSHPSVWPTFLRLLLLASILHGIMKHGPATRTGVVATPAERLRAVMSACGVPSLCEITHARRVEPSVSRYQGGKAMKVQDVMHSKVQSCPPTTNLAAAAAVMWDYDCGALPVVNDTGQVMGMITDRDIAIAAATKGRPAGEIPVSEVISGTMYSCAQDDDIHAALKTMRHAKVRRLPVVNAEGRLQGILCLNDIALRAEVARGKHVPDLSYDEAMSTFKALCEHRVATVAAHA